MHFIPPSGACVDFNPLNARSVVLLYYSNSFSPIQTFQQLTANLDFSITILSGWRTTITLGWGYCMSFHSSYGPLESTFSRFPWTSSAEYKTTVFLLALSTATLTSRAVTSDTRSLLLLQPPSIRRAAALTAIGVKMKPASDGEVHLTL